MRIVTIKKAKAQLNELVDAAREGEEVVLLRNATPVATIVAITEAELELVPALTDHQAERIWSELASGSGLGKASDDFDSITDALDILDAQTKHNGCEDDECDECGDDECGDDQCECDSPTDSGSSSST